jgi:tyrosyl-tRNA synthetase
LEPIQKEYQATPEWKEVETLAYPPPEAIKPVKKVKEKKIGTKAPGAGKKAEASSSGAVSAGLPQAVDDKVVVGEKAETTLPVREK